MYEVLRRKGKIRPVFSIVVDANIDTFEHFDKILDILQKDQKYTNHVWLEQLNGEDDETEYEIFKMYGN